MIGTLAYGTVREGLRKIIHVVRVLDTILEWHEVAEIAEKMRAHALSKIGGTADAQFLVAAQSDE
jgi:hypothetical protein